MKSAKKTEEANKMKNAEKANEAKKRRKRKIKGSK